MVDYVLIFLCLAAFLAGFVDAIIGGGGLIQAPVALILMPQYAVATVIGSLKIPAFTGTSFAAFQYVKKVKLNWKLLAMMAPIAFAAAFAGSAMMTLVSNSFMKPFLIFVLGGIALYTFTKKDFGQESVRKKTKTSIISALSISIVIGFYDGFIGPGTGSFLVLAFISVIGVDFLQASANSKLLNLTTNLGSIFLFILKGKIIWAIAIPMAICNAIGGRLGAKLAIRKGNGFIRIFFLIVVLGTLVRLAYDVW